MPTDMYPTKEEFEDLLRTRSLDYIVETHLFSGMPFSFSDRPEVHRQMVKKISRGLQVPREDICIVGSGRIGFSLSPNNFGDPFNQYSDLDVVVVSPLLFDPSWLDILTNRRTRWSLLRERTQEHLKEHQERHYIYRGWINPSFVAEALGIGEQWVTTFNELSQIPYLSSRSVQGRLYRSWEHARTYHRWSLGKVRGMIAG